MKRTLWEPVTVEVGLPPLPHTDLFDKMEKAKEMSKPELKKHLKARGLYKNTMSEESMISNLSSAYRRETRLARLHEAFRHGDIEAAESITKEKVSEGKKKMVLHLRRNARRVISASGQRRVVQLSITAFERRWRELSDSDLENTICVFDCDRSWVFRPDPRPHRASDYIGPDETVLKFDQEFKDVLIEKEDQGLLFWFRPSRSFEKLSEFFTSNTCPVTNRPYQPLLLRRTWWYTLGGHLGLWEGESHSDGVTVHDEATIPKYDRNVMSIITNMESGSFNYRPVMELLYQSNKQLEIEAE